MPTSPDTPIARAAAALLSDTSPTWLTAHSWRTWYFGEALLDRALPAPDREVAFVAAMLHDLGLTDRYDSEAPFEQSGAAGAERFAEEHGWAAERVATVGAAIRRHLDLDAAQDRPEIALVHLGAAADVVGVRLEQVPDELIAWVLAEQPRHGFVVGVKAALDRQVQAKPTSRIAELYAQLDFGNMIGRGPLDGT